MDADRVIPEYKEFEVSGSAWTDNYAVVQVAHLPCGRMVFGSDDDAGSASLEELLFIAQAHRCID